MNRGRQGGRIWVGLVVVLAALPGLRQRCGAVELVSDGEARAAIVLPEDARGFVRFAGEELQTYVKRATGAELPINPPDPANWPNKVYLSRAAEAA